MSYDYDVMITVWIVIVNNNYTICVNFFFFFNGPSKLLVGHIYTQKTLDLLWVYKVNCFSLKCFCLK